MQIKLFVKCCGNRNSKIYSLKEVQKLGFSNSIQNYKRKDKLTFAIWRLKRTRKCNLPAFTFCYVKRVSQAGFGAKIVGFCSKLRGVYKGPIWQYLLWSFKFGGTKSITFA